MPTGDEHAGKMAGLLRNFLRRDPNTRPIADRVTAVQMEPREYDNGWFYSNEAVLVYTDGTRECMFFDDDADPELFDATVGISRAHYVDDRLDTATVLHVDLVTQQVSVRPRPEPFWS